MVVVVEEEEHGEGEEEHEEEEQEESTPRPRFCSRWASGGGRSSPSSSEELQDTLIKIP